VRRRIGVVIGLDFDDPPANPVDQQRRPDELGSNLMDASIEEGAAEAGWRHFCCSAIVGCGAAATSLEHFDCNPTYPALRRDLAIPFEEIEGSLKPLHFRFF
jgi:hypothetical protein